MNYDFFMGQLRIAAVALIAFAGGKGWITKDDSGTIVSLLPVIGALLGPWAWSIYRNLNMKLVPKDSVAISPDNVVNTTTAKASGMAVIRSDSGKGEVPIAKVVGAILLAMCLTLFVQGDAHAQGTSTAGACSLSIFKSIAPGNFIKQLQTCGVDDAKAALDDASTNKDQEALACLIPLNDVIAAVQANQGKVGILYATQKYRDAKKSGMVTACVNYFNATFLVP